MSRLLIDPNLPLCWEDQQTLRVGFEDAYARIHDPSPAAQRLLLAFLRGIDPDRLRQTARSVGLSEKEARSIMAALGPALITPPNKAPRSRRATHPSLKIAVCDDGREVPGLASALAGTGLCQLDFDFQNQTPDLIVFVERFLEPFERAQRWLMEGIPQLLVRFTDTAVHVGPIVEPPGAPCHSCVALGLVARDQAYPVMAAQLWRVTPRSETPANAGIAAGFAGALIRDWQRGNAHTRSTRVVIPVRQDRIGAPPRYEQAQAHEECACSLG